MLLLVFAFVASRCTAPAFSTWMRWAEVISWARAFLRRYRLSPQRRAASQVVSLHKPRTQSQLVRDFGVCLLRCYTVFSGLYLCRENPF